MVTRSRRAGFTLAEMATVLGIAIVILAFAKNARSWTSQRILEARLRAELHETRDAMERAYADTGWYPTPSTLASATPSTGYRGNGGNPLGVGWTGTAQIPTNLWRGPYMDHVPVDPTTGGAFTWNSTYTGAGNAVYSSNPNYNTW